MSPVSHVSGVSPTGSSDPVKGGGSPWCPCLINTNNPQTTLSFLPPFFFGKYEGKGGSPATHGGFPLALFLHGARGIRGKTQRSTVVCPGLVFATFPPQIVLLPKQGLHFVYKTYPKYVKKRYRLKGVIFGVFVWRRAPPKNEKTTVTMMTTKYFQTLQTRRP